MSQAGKILHLYVEVRSVPEEEGKGQGDMQGVDQARPQGAEVLPEHRGTSAGGAALPEGGRRRGSGGQNVSPSKSPSRHSVSFHLHPGGEPALAPSPAHHRQSLPYDGIGQLLSTLQPVPGGATSLMRSHSSECEPFLGRPPHSPAASGRTTAPATPSGGHRSCEGVEDGEGRRSVVTFSYIEKASIRPVESGRGAACQSGGPSNPFNRAPEETPMPTHLRKRLSDPVWLSCPESPCGSSPKLSRPATGGSQVPFPNLRRATLDSIAKAATNRALEEFGSPELRRRVANGRPDSPGDRQQQQPQPRCQSWAGSPVLARSSSTLPNTHLMDPDRSRPASGLPRSPASDQLSAHTRQSPLTLSPSTRARSQATPNSRQWAQTESPRLPPKVSQAPGKPAQPSHDQSPVACIQSPGIQRANHGASDSPRSAHRVNFNLRGTPPSKPAEGMNQLSGRKSTSPTNSPEMARKLAEEASKLSSIFQEARRTPSPTPSSSDTLGSESPRPGSQSRESQPLSPSPGAASPVPPRAEMNIPVHAHRRLEPDAARAGQGPGSSSPLSHARDSASPAAPRRDRRVEAGSPAIPARLHRPGLHADDLNPSPVRDPRQKRAELLLTDSPTLHRHQPPQYTGDSRSPSLDRRHEHRYERGTRGSPEGGRKFYMGQCGGVSSAEAPVSWTSRQHWGSVSPMGGDSPKAGHQPDQYVSGASPVLLSKKSEQQRREVTLLAPVTLEHQQGAPACDESTHTFNILLKAEVHPEGSSQSSSGVTGSPGEGSQMDRDCISPESSQSSQKSSDTGHATSGIQSDSGSSSVGPSLHSQRIARAKWEFLFGTPSEDANTGSKDIPDASTAPPSGTSSESPTPTPPTSLPLMPISQDKEREEAAQRLASHNVQHVEVELVTPPPAAAGASPKTGIIRRTIKYSETDLDAVPLRCYRETNIDEVLAEQEDADSAFGSNRSVMGTSGTGSSPLGGTLCGRTDGEEEEEEEELEEEEEVVSWASVRMQGYKKRQHATREEDDVFSLVLRRPLGSLSDYPGALKSPIVVGSPRRISEDGLDTFSRHFESIMESHRAKGTSYSSLDSEDLLTSSQPVFTFDLPTLTPEIQGQICQSARQIIELSFAPLARGEAPSVSESTRATASGPARTRSASDSTQPPSGEGLGSTAEDTPPGSSSRSESERRKDAHSPRDKPPRLATDSEIEPDISDRLGSTDTLSNGNKADVEAAKRLAKRLFNLDGFKKSDVARHLSKNNDFSRMVAEEYLRFFNFTGLTLDQALRAFLKEFALMGETQERERVLSHFSRRYLHCNPNAIPSEDSVHTLTCALMLLNTDLHGHNIGKRMSCMQFIGNLEGLNDGQDFPKDLLKALYNSIKNEKLQWTIDEDELRKSFSELADGRTDSASHTMKRISAGGNPFTSVAQQPGALLYKNGFLVRKVHADSDGKKTPRGKRGWKTFYAILKGLILYLQKGEYRPEKQLSDEDLKNAVSIHHSLAMRAADYSKRPNVFYLRTADWRVFLFQAPNAEQMQSWITRINTVAAMFSAPPFPAAIGSQKKFSRPLLPGSTTKLSQEEQVQSHEARFRTTSSELTELRSYPPDRKLKGRELEEYRQREEYLEFEKTRYGTYAMLLRAKIRCGEEDLSAFESRLFEDSGLQRAHSSPTLPQESGQSGKEGQGGGARGGKRGDAQRHSYRQAVKQ